MALTEKQQAFVDALFEDGVDGNIRAAMRVAGYSDKTKLSEVIDKDEVRNAVREATDRFIATSGPEAAAAVVGMIRNPNQLGGDRKLAAAGQVLDRAGHVKKTQVEIEAPSVGLFILPAKSE